MKIVRRILIAVVVYVGIVVVFESGLGFAQPANEATLVIATADEGGSYGERVVSRLESGGQLYVAANHWPRAWFRRALANPEVRITLDTEPQDYLAVAVSGAEHDQVDADNPLSLAFRFITGFPPRHFVRLDPR